MVNRKNPKPLKIIESLSKKIRLTPKEKKKVQSILYGINRRGNYYVLYTNGDIGEGFTDRNNNVATYVRKEGYKRYGFKMRRKKI